MGPGHGLIFVPGGFPGTKSDLPRTKIRPCPGPSQGLGQAKAKVFGKMWARPGPRPGFLKKSGLGLGQAKAQHLEKSRLGLGQAKARLVGESCLFWYL